MIDNPFVITEKVIPRYFCDRELESANLAKLLLNGNNVVLISQRRLGKTSLIQYCYQLDEIRENFLAIYVDILSTTNLQEFAFLLGREVFEVVRSKGEKRWQSFLSIVKSLSGKIGIDPWSGMPTFNLQLGDIVAPEYTLKEIFDYLSNAEKTCIVAIDEFQQISKYPEPNVEALIRSHLLRINNCRMIFSGSERHLLAEMFLSNARPFYQSASFIELNPIPEDIYVEFIIRLFKEKNKAIDSGLARDIYDKFDGITFYIQKVCNTIFANTPVGGQADEQILQDSMAEIMASLATIYRMRLSQLTLRQKELLLAVAQENFVKQITSASFTKKYSLSSPSAIQTALKSLMRDELIVKSERGYVIEDRFFRIWLNRTY